MSKLDVEIIGYPTGPGVGPIIRTISTVLGFGKSTKSLIGRTLGLILERRHRNEDLMLKEMEYSYVLHTNQLRPAHGKTRSFQGSVGLSRMKMLDCPN